MNKVDRFKQITSNMADVYDKKNRNYGDSFSKLIDELGLIAGLVPLHNKLSRATSLIKGDKNEFESLEDTLLDLANYSLMLLMEVENRHVGYATFAKSIVSAPKTRLNEMYENMAGFSDAAEFIKSQGID